MKGHKEVPVLFQEQDGVWLYIQGKDRPKGKNKKKELKLAISYTGWTLSPSSKKEYVVVDKTVCASFSSSNHFKKLTELYDYLVHNRVCGLKIFIDISYN